MFQNRSLPRRADPSTPVDTAPSRLVVPTKSRPARAMGGARRFEKIEAVQVRIPFIPRSDPTREVQIELAPQGWRISAPGFDILAGQRAPAPFDSGRRIAWCREPPFDRDM